jgi:hypothetical protein
MSAAKKKSSSSGAPDGLQRGASWLVGPGRSMILLLLLLGLLGGGWYWAWQHFGLGITTSPQFRVDVQQIEITPQPPWIRKTDVRGEVFHELMRDKPLNVLDDNLAERVARYFLRHPWVANASAQKLAGARVKVDLEYRRPVCMVAASGILSPVDADAVLLPNGDFLPLEANRYPRLVDPNVGEPFAQVAPGQRWMDPRVIGAAEIAATLIGAVSNTTGATAGFSSSAKNNNVSVDPQGALWATLKLQTIEPGPPPNGGTGAENARNAVPAGQGRLSGDRTFWLVSRVSAGNDVRTARIFWGYPPGISSKMPAELPTAEKLARLKRFADNHGSLVRSDGPKEEILDIRTLPPGVIP